MYKLNGHSLTRGVWFIPESQAMTVQERNSVSSITLNPDAPGIDFNDWLLDCEWPEGTSVWRVRDLGDTPTNDTRFIELEHVIRVLDDTSMFGEITTEMISGGETATAEETVRYILAHQSDWVLGDFDFNVSNAYTFNGDSLLDALESVMGTLDNPVWEYDMGQYPFVLHIRERSNAVGSEMRGCRNLSTLRRSVSRNGFYTRFYPIGKNDLHITGDYLSKNENLYGRVDKVETDQTKDTEGALEAWAQGKLNRHCEPRVTITVTGLELSAETGEDLDRLKLNRYCSVPLPEFGTTICERITRLQFRDRIKEPENVTVTLCNNLLDISEIIREEQRAGSAATGRAGRAQAKQNYMFEANGEHLLYEVFDECGHLHGILRMTSESLRVAFDNAIECTRGEFLMTSESLRISFMNEIECTRSQFELTSESLRISFMNEMACTRSSFEMTSESLRVQFLSEISSTRSEFEMTSESLRVEFQAADSSIRSLVEQTASTWSASISGVAGSDGKVTAGSIALAINNSGSNAYINADHVYVTGTTKINDVLTIIEGAAVFSRQVQVTANNGVITLNGGKVSCTQLQGGTLTLVQTQGESQDPVTQTIGVSDLQNMLVDASVDSGTNTLTLTKKNGTQVTFRKAASSTLTPSWSGDTLTITASPGSASYTVGFSGSPDTRLDVAGNGSPTVHTESGSQTKYLDVPVKVFQVNGGGAEPTTRYTASLTVDGTLQHTRGRNAVGLAAGTWLNGVFSYGTSGRPTEITNSTEIDVKSNGSATASALGGLYMQQPFKVFVDDDEDEVALTGNILVDAGDILEQATVSLAGSPTGCIICATGLITYNSVDFDHYTYVSSDTYVSSPYSLEGSMTSVYDYSSVDIWQASGTYYFKERANGETEELFKRRWETDHYAYYSVGSGHWYTTASQYDTGTVTYYGRAKISRYVRNADATIYYTSGSVVTLYDKHGGSSGEFYYKRNEVKTAYNKSPVDVLYAKETDSTTYYRKKTAQQNS